MKIAVVAPPWLAIPPVGYGGIEALVADTAVGLAARGHEVDVISAGPATSLGAGVRRFTTFDEPRVEQLGAELPAVTHAAEALRIVQRLGADVVHDHTTAFSLAAGALPCPVVLTVHGPPDGDLLRYVSAVGPTVALVAISDNQRRQAEQLPWYATVRNGLVVDPIPFGERPSADLVFLGRMSADKGAHLAIDLAREAGRRIRIAGKCSEPLEQQYFEAEIRPRLGPEVEWLGELGSQDKYEVLGNCAALLFPVQWEEPFGLVMIESMACGTPVLSLASGSVAEVVVDGVTGFVRDQPSELLPCIEALPSLSRSACRAHVRENFSIDRTVTGYEQVYQALAGAGLPPDPASP